MPRTGQCGRRYGAHRYLILCPAVIAVCVAARPAPPPAPIGDRAALAIVYFDPDANYQRIPAIMSSLERYVSRVGPSARVMGAHDLETFRSKVVMENAAYAIVASHYLDEAFPFDLEPLLVPESSGKTTYRKVLLDRGEGTAGNLAGRRIAMAGLGSGAEVRTRIMKRLLAAGLNVRGAEILPLAKDIDALFALSVGQAEAALVTRASVAWMAEIDPTTSATYRELWVSPAYYLPTFCAVKAHEAPGLRKAMLAALRRMADEDDGRRSLRIAGIDRWVDVSAAERASNAGDPP